MKNHIKDMLNHITEADYQGLKPMLETIDDFARSSYQAIYIIDRYKDNSLFVSNCDNFFLHQSPEEVKAEGFEVILQHILKEDREMAKEVYCATLSALDSLSYEDKM